MAPPELNATPEQRRAILTQDRALVVEAGAGTGKTWVLVQRFLALLENHPDWSLDSIVAVTFTEKAAREMRGRIRRAIEGRAADRPDQPIWQSRRRELDRLIVGTIHGLCARILRENAIAAAIDPRFSVLDEEESTLLKEEAIETTLATLAEADSPALELLSSLMVTDLRREMENLLNRRGIVKQLFDTLPDQEILLARWRLGLAEMKAALQSRLTTDEPFQHALQDLPAIPLPADTSDSLYPHVVTAQEGCRLWQAGDGPAALPHWLSLNLRGGKQANWGGKEALTELKAGLTTLRSAAQTLEKAGFALQIGPDDEEAAALLQRWRLLWEALETTYAGLKATRQALDFDDLELEAVKLLEQTPRQPRLAAFMSRVQHLMVDEFQDTNPVQKRIVYALAGPAEPGRLFVVGDAKQSIYRFRQAQVSLFNAAAADVAAHHEDAILPLSRSFRSHSNLVAGFNDLFASILQPLHGVHEAYEAAPGPLTAQRESPPAGQPPIELHILPAKVNDESLSAADARAWEARRLAERLQALQREQFLVWADGAYRPFRYGDAAILFRATTNLPLYEAQFQAAGLPYLTVGGRGYYDRTEIQDLMALLAALYNPADDLNLATALRSPLFSLNDETLYRLRWRDSANERPRQPRPLLAALAAPPPTEQPEAVEYAAAVLSELGGLVRRVDVWQLLRAALDLTGYEAAMLLADRAEGQGGRRYQNVQKFLGLARERGEADLAQFLRRLQLLKAREAREGEATAGEGDGGAVKLMSIHAAKGLEFPVVVVADLGRNSRPPRAERILHDPAFGLVCQRRDELGEWQKPAGFLWAEWLNEQMEIAESKRLLYVACTRAADRLILSGRQGRGANWLNDICAAWEIEAEGDRDETRTDGGYTLRILRPDTLPELYGEPRQSGDSQSGAPLDAIPPLAAPLPPLPDRRPRAASRSQPTAAQTPLQRIASAPDGRHRASLGQLIHRALADWACLSLPGAARRAWLARYEPDPDLVDRADQLLARFAGSQSYQEINRATRRYSELPFHLQSAAGPIVGVIDLLYQAEAGQWHLVDWKTERIQGDPAAAASPYFNQLAIYSLAAEEFLRQPVSVSILFLRRPDARYQLPAAQLRQIQGEMGLLAG